MIIQDKDRLTQILHDPEVYYFYYHEKYHATLKTIHMLEEKNATPEFLVHLRVVLGEMCGKCAIAIGAMNNCDRSMLLRNWVKIEKSKETASLSFENLDNFENNIIEVEQECLEAASKNMDKETEDPTQDVKFIYPYNVVEEKEMESVL